MSDDEYFLVTCEKLWRLSQDRKTLLTRAARAGDAGDEDANQDLADRIDLNHVKRRLLRLLLMRAKIWRRRTHESRVPIDDPIRRRKAQ